MKIGMTALASTLLLASAASAQDGPPAAEVKAAKEGMKAFRDGEYMRAEALLRPFAIDAAGKRQNGYAAQMWEQTHAAVADWLVPSDDPWHGLEPADRAALDRASFTDAIDAIVRRARDTRVVILNENHSDSRGRAFALEVARALRPLGYDVLAAETFDNTPVEAMSANRAERIVERGALLRPDGYYTRDPVFADFVRGALTLGYRPVAYEATRYDPKMSVDQSIASRERQQAETLYRRTLAHRPNAKVFIYVGFSHAAERPTASSRGGANRWMAARLKALSGIDPLTIDQTTIRLPDPPRQDDALTAALAPRIGAHSVVAMQGTTPLVLGQYAGKVDLQVIHPLAHGRNGRPDWLAVGREPLAIPSSMLPTSGERLIQVFAADDPADTAIPLDQLLLTPGAAPAPLLVPPGLPMRFAYQDPPAAK